MKRTREREMAAAGWMAWLEKYPDCTRFRLHHGRKDLKKVKSRVMDDVKRARR
jgi:hypothetical protein